MNTRIHLLIVLCAMNALSACSLLDPVKMQAVSHFTIDRFSEQSMSEKRSDKTVMVMRTVAAPGYDTSSMLYRKQPYQLDSFALNEWVAPPQQMMANLLERSLNASHAFAAVVGPNFTGDADYSIESTLQRLDQDFTQSPGHAVLTLSVHLVENRTHKIIASEQFTKQFPTTQGNAYGGVLAANAATHELMREVTAFVVRHAR